MNTKMKIKMTAGMLLATLLGTASIPVYAAELSGREIMERVDARDEGDRKVSDMTMTLIDKRGSRRIRTIRSYSMMRGTDELSAMFFLSPADVKNSAFLTYDYDESNRDDDQWLYLPALRKSKRIAASDKSGSFMGSDFTYSDMTKRDLDDYDYTLLKEVKVRDADAWLIQTVPRTKEVIVRVEGGEVGEECLWVEDTPDFEQGERVLLFLRPAGEGYFKTIGGFQGMIPLERNTRPLRVWRSRIQAIMEGKDPAKAVKEEGELPRQKT